MTNQRLLELIERVLTGEANVDERAALENWYQDANAKEVVWPMESPDEEEVMEKRMLAQLHSHISLQNKPRFYDRLRPALLVAAIFLIVCTVLISVNYNKRSGNVSKGEFAANISAEPKLDGNRYFTLPDSSIVVLHPGSKLSYLYSPNKRELYLTGEAFFNVKHDKVHPFVVHTGAVTTTVLGTSFAIKAYFGQKVVVAVKSGKVSVSDPKRVVAVLTPNQSVEVGENKQVTSQSPPVNRVSDGSLSPFEWVSGDMQFEDMTYKELVDKLSRRYGVNIGFKNSALESCPITGRFAGTETIEQVLQIITSTTSTQYAKNESGYLIDGEACSKQPLKQTN